MHTLRNTCLIAVTELSRALITRRGLLSLTAFTLVWILILTTIIRTAPLLVQNGASIGSMLGSETILSIAKWKVEEFGVHWFIGLYIFPICSIFYTADQTASDRVRGTLKLLTLHTSRSSLFLGRFFGMMTVQAIVIALTLISTLVVAVLRDPALLSGSVANAWFIWVNLMIVIAPYTALMAVISLFAKSGMQAMTYASILWIVLLFVIHYLSSRFPEAELLKTIFPGSQVSELVKHHDWSSLVTVIIPAIQTLVFLVLGLFIMHRVDL